MLAKIERISRLEARAVILSRLVFRTDLFSARFIKAKGFKAGVVVSKKIADTAVKRNFLRRRTYSALRALKHKPSVHVLVYPKPNIEKANISDITQSFEEVFSKINS